MERDTLFWFCALAGSGLFAIQFILNFLGTGDEGEMSDLQFKWISKQAIASFLMMFGWIGLTCLKEFHFGISLSVGIAIASGVASIFVFGLLMKWARSLHSTGTVFRLEEAMGKRGIVYQRIPQKGVGKISISLHNLTHEIDAVSLDESEIASFTTVEVIKQRDEKTLVVVSVKPGAL